MAGARFNTQARFKVTSDVKGKPLVIRDLGPWDEHLTVTNDAERVVQELDARGLLTPGRQVFYFDSDNRLDEIVWGLNAAGEAEYVRIAPGSKVLS